MKSNKLILTEENYYTPENIAISNSKVGDYLRSKEYYKAKHIDHSVREELTPSMKMGKMVDCIFSEGMTGFHKAYRMKEGRGDKDDSDGRVPVTEKEWTKATEMGELLTSRDFYRFYQPVKNEDGSGQETVFQLILQSEIPHRGGRIPICGKPDAVTLIYGAGHIVREIIIDDLKTAALGAMKNNDLWYWHCRDLGYFRQFAVYSMMLKKMFPTAKKIWCRHAVISTTKLGLYKINLWIIPKTLLVEPRRQFIQTVKDIVDEKVWKDPQASWNEAKILRKPEQKVQFEPLSEMTEE